MGDAKFTNSEGRTFTVRVVMPGDAYGLNGCLTHVGNDGPMVEFYDATYDVPKFHAVDSMTRGRGQFVSRYYLDTLKEGVPGIGLNLMGYEAAWKIDGDTMDEIMVWLQQEVGV